MRVCSASAGRIDGNDVETLLSRKGNTLGATSSTMSGNLSFGAAGNLDSDTQVSELEFRCECGAMISAYGEDNLIELARLHFGEFHPELGANIPGDLILAMAEQKGESLSELNR